MNNAGLLYAILAYFLWGVVPIFWRELAHVDSVEIVAHRMVWSSVMVSCLVLFLGQWSKLKVLFKNRQMMWRLLASSILISINWGIYIWAVNNGRIVEGSMGYYINPLINVLFGTLFFGESLRRNQMIAVALAGLGVGYLIVFYGEVPWVALTLAVTFACYGAVKKSISVPATHGMAVETGLLIVPAIAYLMYLHTNGDAAFGTDTKTDVLLILGGLVTLVPLVLFSKAAQSISMTALGMTQYLGPTLQLIIGVLMYGEEFGSERQIAFGCIWIALLIYSLDQLNHRRRRKIIASSAGPVRIE
jgi:chloramphenicol-sensitive protein RarD